MTDYAYTTPSLVQAELRASDSFDTDTIPTLSTVNEWIKEESDKINQLSGTVWGSTSYTDTIDYNNETGYDITLRNSPLISVDSVKYRTSVDGQTPVWVSKTETTDYIPYTEEGKVRIVKSNWNPSIGSKNIEIQYTAGYSTTPAFIQRIATKAVALRLLNTLISQNVNERNDGGSISVGNISIVEPSSYGVNSYKVLRDEVSQGYSTLSEDSFKVYRYGY